MTPAEWMNLIEARANALRSVGVVRVSLSDDTCTVEFAPHIESPVVFDIPGDDKEEEEPESSVDPLDDPFTFGGASPPGFSKLHEGESDQ